MRNAGKTLGAIGLAVVVGTVLLAPYTDYQEVFDQCDRGRDLYASKKTLDGDMVYRDYWWIYGPIMPYYYALSYRLLGISARSALIGQQALILLCGVLVFLAALPFTSSACAVVAAAVFWVYYPDFPHTYMYTGGVVCVLLAVCFLFRFIRRPGRTPLLLATGALVAGGLVKFNIGPTMFCALLLSVAAADLLREGRRGIARGMRRYVKLTALFMAGLTISYLPFTRGLPTVLRLQSFPFGNERRPMTPSILRPVRGIAAYLAEVLASDWRYPLLACLALVCLARSILLIARDRRLGTTRDELGAAMISLAIVALFSIHEYFINVYAIYYQLIWAFPPILLLCVLAVHAGTRGLPRAVRYGVAAVILACAATSFMRDARAVGARKVPERYLGFERGGVYLNNPLEWMEAVHGAVDYLMWNVGEDEKIVAFPCDTLYCFLSGRDSAIRQQEIFFFSHPTVEQEREIIEAMERRNVRWAVLSNMYRSTEPGKGDGFGVVCCFLLSGYIEEHFSIAAVFGPWYTDPPWWIEGHGVAVLQRRDGPRREPLFWPAGEREVRVE
ncbi:MAG: hypothetical protein PHN82_03930 [bacterium]|nr:hypothetical protein [bacterium]